MAYPRIQMTGIDYGPRSGTLGWNIHMAEGGDGTAAWLSRRAGEDLWQWADRVNGVSASFVIYKNGTQVQMVPWDHAAGNLNPEDRSTDKGFYGPQVLRDVLGDKWRNPNEWTLSVEFTGFRADGLTDAQIASFIELNKEARERFPTMRGAFGHADQTDTKGCPGTHPSMLRLWDTIGHGLFNDNQEDNDMVRFERVSNVGGTITINRDTAGIPINSGNRPAISAGITRPTLGTAKLLDLENRLCYLMWVGNDLCFVAAADVTFAPNDGPNTVTGYTQAEMDAAVAATRDLTKDKAITAIENI